MASRRQSLKALAEERGMRTFRPVLCDNVDGALCSEWISEAADTYAIVRVHAPTRLAATEGLRAALESMPLKRKGRG